MRHRRPGQESTRTRAHALGACAIFVVVLLLGGCGGRVGTSSTATTHTQTPTITPALADTSTSALSPAQMAGQRVIYGYRGLVPPKNLLTLISHGEAAGVIFFSDNISSKGQLKAVIRKLERANAALGNPVRAPLLLMIDQEGGRVRRLPGLPLLGAKQIGKSGDPVAAASKAGRDAGLNLRGVGLNVNLAPVLDVYSRANGFDDRYGRSYSMQPSVVSTLGAAFIRAQQEEGVAATAKHFPGLGAATASQNTDNRRVALAVPLDSLLATDEAPFKSAIGAQVKLVMLSWAVYPALDSTAPAGLSSAIIQGQLREALGFKGVTITDDLAADALKAYGTLERRAELAAGVGMDLMLCPQTESHASVGARVMGRLKDDYMDGTLSRPAFQASVRRIIALRRSLGN